MDWTKWKDENGQVQDVPNPGKGFGNVGNAKRVLEIKRAEVLTDAGLDLSNPKENGIIKKDFDDDQFGIKSHTATHKLSNGAEVTFKTYSGGNPAELEEIKAALSKLPAKHLADLKEIEITNAALVHEVNDRINKLPIGAYYQSD
ncbi:MAG: hypothetical protein LWY06_12535 [Firmicutes bacterium]|nr:hypothetical protein [Bacillota bacterium]